MEPRSKKACISCRDRKRKCDGELPCSYCIRTHHECFYQETRRTRSTPRKRSSEDPSSREGQSSSTDERTQLQLLEANSPAVFVQRLAIRGETPSIALPVHCYAYNLGFDADVNFLPNVIGLTELVTKREMARLANVYFAQISPVYDFIDCIAVEQAIITRWNDPVPWNGVDSLLLGIAALGCVFDKGSHINGPNLERQLVYSARMTLEYSSQLAQPHVNHVVGWLLRVIYLRINSTPHATWMASCTLMHMIETSKLHFENDTESILFQYSSDYCPPEERRKIYHVARLFNIWVSLDFGKSQIDLRGASTQPPQTSWTTEQRELYLVSVLLTSTEHYYDLCELESALRKVCELQPSPPMLQLLQCNIALCTFRRAISLEKSLPAWAQDLILDLMRTSTGIVEGLVAQSSPWWHVLNIPFQIVCVLLLMDRPRALETLDDALRTLHTVATHYDTQMAKEAYDVALSLVQQHRDQRSEALSILDRVLEAHSNQWIS